MGIQPDVESFRADLVYTWWRGVDESELLVEALDDLPVWKREVRCMKAPFTLFCRARLRVGARKDDGWWCLCQVLILLDT